MYCKNCGKEIPADSVFCQICGVQQFDESTGFMKEEKPTEEKPLMGDAGRSEAEKPEEQSASEKPVPMSEGEGATEVMPVTNVRSVEELVMDGYRVNIGNYVSRGWEIFSGYMGGFVGFFAIVALVLIFVRFIPFFGGIISLAISGPLSAGFVIVAFKRMRGQTTEFGDFFLGFNYFLQLLLLNLVIGIFVGASVGLGVLFIALPIIIRNTYLLVLIFPGILLFLLGLYLSISYVLAIPVIVDRKYDFWQAMEASRRVITKKWFSVLLFLIVLGLINLAGAIALLIGLLFTGPLVNVSLAAAYEDIFGLEAEDFGRP